MIDWTNIIVAALALLGTAFGSWLGVRESNKLVNFRLDSLEEKVTRHNNVVERVAVLERDLKTAFRLIDDRQGDNR